MATRKAAMSTKSAKEATALTKAKKTGKYKELETTGGGEKRERKRVSVSVK